MFAMVRQARLAFAGFQCLAAGPDFVPASQMHENVIFDMGELKTKVSFAEPGRGRCLVASPLDLQLAPPLTVRGASFSSCAGVHVRQINRRQHRGRDGVVCR